MDRARTAAALVAILALAACGRGVTNNSASAPANGAAAANRVALAPAPATAPPEVAADDPVRRAIAARWPVGLPVTPAEIRQMIDATTASDTVVALVGREERTRWQTVLHGIALGEPEWIEIARQIAPAVDGEAAEGFYAALSDTLVTRPTEAVRLIGTDGADGYCTDNGAIEDAAEKRAWFAAAIAAVEAVAEPDLQAQRTACLAKLRADAPR